MTLEQIKQALERGQVVHWINPGYQVVKDKIGQYLIKFMHTGDCIGLFTDNNQLNGNESEFFIK